MTDSPIVADDATDGRRPPSLGTGVFLNFLDRLNKSGVPAIIDRHFIGGSGTNQSQMMTALTFLQLIDDESKPTQELHDLAEKEEQRPAFVRQLVERHYAGALALGPRATQSQLDQWFRQQGVNGDTARKAESFFLSLAKLGGIEVSPHFKVTRASPTTTAKRMPRAKTRKPVFTTSPPVPPPPSSPADSKRIHPAVTALLDKIPAPGTSWTRKERDLLVETFGNLLDLFHPVTDDAEHGSPGTRYDRLDDTEDGGADGR